MSEVPKPSEPAASPYRRKTVDARALMSIQNLELRARSVVEGFLNGLHRSPYHGFSVEFTEYRQYTPGDDPRYLDWRLYARSDRYYIKKFEDETNLACYFLVDKSKSMHFGTVGYTKADYAITTCATLATFLQGQGDAVGLLSFDESARSYLPPKTRAGHLRHLLVALEKHPEGQTTDLGAPLKRIAELVRRRSLMILISDLLAPLDALEKHLSRVAACGHELIVFQILDPAEINFTFHQPALFRDLESEKDIYVDPDAARAAYKKALTDHLTAAKAICDKLGTGYYHFSTTDPLENVLRNFVQDRRERGRLVRRK